MSMPVSQQPPEVTIAQHSFSTNSSHGTIGPVIAVLLVIMILGIVAVMIGRLCSGRRILGYGQYDIESWAETHCSSCIDGRISPPPPSLHPNLAPNSALPSMPTQSHQEIKNEDEEGHSPQHPPENL